MMHAYFRPSAFVLMLAAQPALAQLVVNEIDYDQPGGDTAEFLEIKNISAGAVDLSAYSVVLVNGSIDTIYQTIILPNVSLGAGEYYVLCEDAGTVANCDLDILNSIQNGSPDAVAIVQGATTIDTVSYEGDTLDFTEGSGNGLTDVGSAGFENSGLSRFPDGVDSNVNNVDLSARCISPGGANISDTSNCPAPEIAGIVINEIDYDQPGTDNAEFVEIFVTGNQPVDLGGLNLVLIDGATGTFYATVPLNATTVAPGAYYVVCNNPGVTPNCDQTVATPVDWLQNGAPDAIALTQVAIVLDTVSYDGDSPAPWTEGSGAGLVDNDTDIDVGLSRFPNGNDSDSNNTDLTPRCITPGAANTSVTAPCDGGASVEIHAIQGNGLATPLEGTTVSTLDNVVTGVTPDGFFMQTPDARADADPETSQGIFVFTNTAPAVAVGDQVDVTGQVGEFFDLTEITNSPLVSVDNSGNPLPTPVVFDAATPSPLQPQPATEVERYEGMLISADGVATGATDRFGDTPVTTGPVRPFREPGIAFPGLPGLPVWDGNPELFEVDVDGAGLPDVGVFGGQDVTASGPLAFSFGDYQILPTSLSLGAVPTLPRAVRATVAGELAIASQNVLRIFDMVDDPLTDDPIISLEEYTARLMKFSYHARVTLGAPDIIALQEVENLTVVQAMADQILVDDAALSYSAHLIEGNDVGGIDVAYLTRDDTISVLSLTQHGANELLTFDGSLLNDRPPLVLEAEYLTGGTHFPLTVINVHQRSLGGIEGNESTRVRTKRHEQAMSLAGLVQDLQTTDPDIHLVVTGDFNAFQFTDGYVDVMGQVTGIPDPLGAEFTVVNIVSPALTNEVLSLTADERYSFVFDGSAQSLDHTLTSSALAGFVRGFEYSRGNADAPNTLIQALGPDIGLRIADHDGYAVYLMTDFDGDGVADDADNCTNVPNADQRDTNNDNFGNVCDTDINNDGITNVVDLGLFKAVFFSADPDADFNGDGIVNVLDLGVLKLFFFLPPGPSGVAP